MVTGTLRHTNREDIKRVKSIYLQTNFIVVSKPRRMECPTHAGARLDQERYGIWAVNTKLRKRLEENFER